MPLFFYSFNEIDCACSCYTLLVSMENKIIEWSFLRCCFFSGLYHNDCVVIIPYDSWFYGVNWGGYLGCCWKTSSLSCYGYRTKSLKHPILLFFLQGDDKYEFSDPARIQGLVKNYSQFVSFPIYTWQEKSRTVEVRCLKLSFLSGRLFGRLKISYLSYLFFKHPPSPPRHTRPTPKLILILLC